MRICAALLLSTSALFAATTDVLAQAKGQFNSPNNNSIEREIKVPAALDVRVAIYTSIRSDCNSGPLPSIRLAVAPDHGSVPVKHATLKPTNLKQCLALKAPAFVAFYHADWNFNDADCFKLEIDFSEGRKQVQFFYVSVSQSPPGGEGI